ncbi:MAG TPA: beta-galactosidase [Arachnia sp.]|nr:beta-galactosidase [Arachnia sp.]HMT86772.1 beta-galactosidase [Arachnia sp.]
MPRFAIGDHDFLLDGQPHRILSGALHYFRIHPGDWADRIAKARGMGLNTIETYVAWNAHEPSRGVWDATGGNDLGRFLDLVAEAGMHAIVRPGPYICAEWHNGGLPAWLTALPGIGLRRSEPQYLAEVEAYLRRVYEIVAPRQINRGGNVVLVQIENEYGAYGADKEYLTELVRITKDAGITVPLTTVDQPQPQMLRDGSLPGLHLTGSFGSRAAERLATLREHQPTGPLMCSEFWCGWFDWWGNTHHTTSAADSAAELDALLAAGASVNVYMVHGGTNFGLTNGANHKGRYLPLATSYDYDAPLDEAGDPTEKYFAFRDVIAKHAPVPAEAPVAVGDRPVCDAPLSSLGDWRLAVEAPAVEAEAPPTFEDLAHVGALVEYTAELPAEAFGAESTALLTVDSARDMAWVEVDGVRVGSLSRTRHERRLVIPRGRTLSILVEDLGRVNYGPRIGEAKGLIGQPRVGGVPLTGWTATPLDVAAIGTALTDAQLTDATGEELTAPASGPVALRGEFALATPSDLFLSTDGWGKGYAFVNGFFLGRYWSNGPQRTLYVPRPATRSGVNAVVLLELEGTAETAARFVARPDLGPTEE